MHHLAIALAVVEASAPCISWTERVPSASNIADFPSRREGWKAHRLGFPKGLSRGLSLGGWAGGKVWKMRVHLHFGFAFRKTLP